MRIDRPTWTLRESCPVCGQGACLVIQACPSCSRLAVCCGEEGTWFRGVRDLTAVSDRSLCSQCSEHPLADFVRATDDQIQAGGLASEEYA